MTNVYIKQKWLVMLVICVCLMFFVVMIDFYGMFILSNLPRLEVRQGIGYDDGKWTSGRYIVQKNKVVVYIGSLDIDGTVVHEYCHYIYGRRMTNEEIQQWKDISQNITYIGYEHNRQVAEHFARTCEMIRKRIVTNDSWYVQKMMEKYIK